jgi:SAM-dependent methyltransferase
MSGPKDLTGMRARNIDVETVRGFGDEWTRFDQRNVSQQEREELFSMYFAVFPFSDRSTSWEGFDLGCGSGRWAALVAPRVGRLHLIDASAEALAVARRNLEGASNCDFRCESVDDMSLPDGSQDFGYSLGVLHHVPDTAAALASCVRKLKPGAPFLLYLYYAFDNRPWWFTHLWRASDSLRRVVARLPHGPRYLVSQVLAVSVYWPLARLAALGARAGIDVRNWPLTFYAHRSFTVMRNDALDRFGTRLEQRFTRARIAAMMTAAGLEDIQFSPRAPFWCAVGYRRKS